MHIPLEIQNKQLYFEGSAAAAAPAEGADARAGLSAKLVGFADAVRRGTGPPGGGRDAQLAVSVLEEVHPPPPFRCTYAEEAIGSATLGVYATVGSPAPTCTLGALSWGPRGMLWSLPRVPHAAEIVAAPTAWSSRQSGAVAGREAWKGTVVYSPSSQRTLL